MRTGITSVDGVKAVDVSLENGTAKVLCDEHVTSEKLIQAVEDAGFKASLRPPKKG